MQDPAVTFILNSQLSLTKKKKLPTHLPFPVLFSPVDSDYYLESFSFFLKSSIAQILEEGKNKYIVISGSYILSELVYCLKLSSVQSLSRV